MPGISPQDARSEHSESSVRSSDSKTQGKKVSFNRAVRVKQYPWQPDESPELEERPDRRFWFKVYRNSTNPVSQPNTWRHNDRSVWGEGNGENSHDSLTPIAEDEDVDVTDSTKPGCNHGAHGLNGNNFSPRPSDPPIDYNDDYNLLSRTGRYSLRRLDQFTPEINLHTHSCGENHHAINLRNEQHRTKVANGFLSPLRNPDFRRPTIASAAKYSTDKPFKQPVINVRLPRPIAKETPFDRRKNGSLFSSSQRSRERRSKSNDDTERFRDRTNRIDKAVSTEDLSSNLGRLEYENGNGIYSSQKKSNKDKATQCTGTLTNYRKISENPRSVLKPTKPTLSTIFTQDTTDTSPVRKKTDNNEHSYSNGTDSKQLLLRGKSCFTSNGFNGTKKIVPEIKVPLKENLHYSDGNSTKPNGYINDRLEYDYVTNTTNTKLADLGSQPAAEHKPATNGFGNGEKHKRSSWKTMVDNNIDVDSIICNDDEALEDYRYYSQTADKRSSSTIGHIQGKQVPMSTKKRHMSSDGITKTSNTNDIQMNRNYFNETGSKYSVLKDHSSSYNGGRYGMDDIESPIDWSTSGFRLGARSANNLSSNSDSEFVIHRRPPLLMYIPGVSHHNKPAVEDDRLSARNGFSRSEGEDDLSPLSVDAQNVFSRRYSMPRNRKSNFLKWKYN